MKGILMKPWKHKFIREHPDTELQTRRVINPQPDCKHYEYTDAEWKNEPTRLVLDENGRWHCSLCSWGVWFNNWNGGILPRYQVGEVVYIKEAWATDKVWDKYPPSMINPTAPIWYTLNTNWLYVPKWIGRLRSPLHLRDDFARDFIKILDVKSQRLQEITRDDCFAEGLDENAAWYINEFTQETTFAPIIAYSWLWNSINPKYPWESNPWVWGYIFKYLTRQGIGNAT